MLWWVVRYVMVVVCFDNTLNEKFILFMSGGHGEHRHND